MNKKIIAVGLLALLGIGGGVFYGKNKVETEVNEKVFNQIKSLENKFVDINGTKNGSVILKKENVKCVVTSSVECVINDLVINNKLSTTTIKKITVTNVEAALDFDNVMKDIKNKKPITIKNNIGIVIEGVTMVGDKKEKLMQGMSFDKISLTVDTDITNNIAKYFKGSITTVGLKMSKFDKVQTIPNADISLDTTDKGSLLKFKNENFSISANTTQDLRDFTNIEVNKRKLADINNIDISLSFNKSLLDMEKSFFELFQYNGMPANTINTIKAQIELVNQAIANKKVFVPNTRKGFPQYIQMIERAGMTLKNKEADLEKVLSYVIGDTNTIQISVSKKVIEVQ